jgi:hypothetical protein
MTTLPEFRVRGSSSNVKKEDISKRPSLVSLISRNNNNGRKKAEEKRVTESQFRHITNVVYASGHLREVNQI